MTIAVIAQILNAECRIPEGLSAEEIIREVMKKGKNHWMAHTESQAFDASIAVAYLKMNDEDKKRMKATTDTLRALQAAISGVPVDMVEALERVEGIELFPLQKMWSEIT